MPETLILHPRGPFSLEAAAGFGFGPNTGRPKPEGGIMRLAFPVDGFGAHAGVVLRQDAEGVVHGEVYRARDVEAVERQVARILSLDHDGEAWAAVGERDPVIGRLQAAHPGLRPVLFHSPYEGAAWSIISARRPARQAAEVRRRLSVALGAEFELAGEPLAAFPLPERLLEVEPMPGLPEEKCERLRGVARATLERRLDPERLQAMEPEEAMADLQSLKGIGPFYAGLVVIRATGLTDVLPAEEPRSLRAAAHFYGLDGPPDSAAFTALAEPWRPFRTWAVVLLRVAGDRAGVTAG